MTKVLVADKLDEAGLVVLRDTPGIELVVNTGLTPAALAEAVADVDVLVVRSSTKVTAAVLAAAKKLTLVGRAGIGVDNVDVAAATQRGVMVMNAPSGNSITTAEHAIAMLMALARRIPQATASMRAGRWEKSRFVGMELHERTLGVVGLGNIWRLVARRAAALGMHVIACDPIATPEAARHLGAELVPFDSLLGRADAITVHVPLSGETRGMLGAKAFARVQPGVLVVNCARGGIVDEAALLEALERRQVGGAALDVFETEPPPADHPLLARDDVICTPHLGASTAEAQRKVAVELARQVADYVRKGEIRNALNLPGRAGTVAGGVGRWVEVANHLGRFHAQAFGPFDRVEVTCAGPAFADGAGVPLVASAALGGLLSQMLNSGVNLVNAPGLAEEHGIAVGQTWTPTVPTFHNMITVVLWRGETRSETAAALFNDREPRLVRLDTYHLEAPLRGRMLLVHNEDRPGVIGHVGTTLGNAGINVSQLHVGLAPGTSSSVSLWTVDNPVPEDTVARLAALIDVTSVRSLTV